MDTLIELRADLDREFDQYRLFTIRGDDAVMKIRTWRCLEQFFELAEMIVIPRDGHDLDAEFSEGKRLAQGIERTWIMDDLTGIPPTSSSGVRRAMISGSYDDLDIPAGLLPIMQARGMYGLTAPGDGWIDLYRPGYSGANKQKQDQLRRDLFGEDPQRTAFCWGCQTITYNAALQLYEDACMAHFQADPDVLEWLLETACDVYDNSDSNVFSRHDYSIQEARTTHLQDIAVRRCIMGLGKAFRGDHLVEIRDKSSEGYRLNPGQASLAIPSHLSTMELSALVILSSDDWGPNKAEADV